jgi:hypothetical protein
MPSDGIGVASSVPWPPLDPCSAPAEPSKLHLWANGEASFGDFLDTINPLEHLPIISTVYNWIVGKHDIGDLPRIAGDALYGGPWGALSGLFNSLLKEETGKDIGEQVVAAIIGGTYPTGVATEADPAQTTAPAPVAPAAPPVSAAPAPSAAAPKPPTSSSPNPNTAAQNSAADSPLPIVPAHPPMPLSQAPAQVRSAGKAAAAPTAPSSADPAAKAFLAQTAERERELYRSAGTPGDNGRILNSQPVPLVVPPGALPNGGRPRLMPGAASVPSPSAAATAPPSPDTPVDVSQKMLDALDKYTALEKQRANQKLGSQVDETP